MHIFWIHEDLFGSIFPLLIITISRIGANNVFRLHRESPSLADVQGRMNGNKAVATLNGLDDGTIRRNKFAGMSNNRRSVKHQHHHKINGFLSRSKRRKCTTYLQSPAFTCHTLPPNELVICGNNLFIRNSRHHPQTPPKHRCCCFLNQDLLKTHKNSR